MKPALLDAGVIVALFKHDEPAHAKCAQTLATLRQPLITCEAVIVESCYLLRRVSGAPEKVLANIEKGMIEIGFQLSQSPASVMATMRKYHDVPADLADACLIQMADELDTGDILTLDSDFLHYRWRKTKRFNLLIPLG